MRTTFLPTLLGAGCALIASAALTVAARADSVVTINPDGSVAQVEPAQDGTQQSFSNARSIRTECWRGCLC
jgi:parvulin-like peptidyl-prolyl isomerase